MTWEDAKTECAKLGDGWRLPTKDELDILYRNRQTIGGFKLISNARSNSKYWSSDEAPDDHPWLQGKQAWSQAFFRDNFQVKHLKTWPNNVRAVRSF